MEKKVEKGILPWRGVEQLIRYSGLKPRIVSAPVHTAIGKVIADDAIAGRDNPSMDISMMDGYALRSEDLFFLREGKLNCIKIVGSIDPRNAGFYTIGPGEAVYVDTGFPIPRGSDAVLPYEKANVRDRCLYTQALLEPGDNVALKGSIFRKGEKVASRGTVITGIHARGLLDAGVVDVKVYEPPTVLLIPVGDELAEPWESKAENMVYEGTRYLLREILSDLPSRIVESGIVPDSPDDIGESLKRGIRVHNPDIIVLISGSSGGRKDYSWNALTSLFNPTYSFRNPAMRPGRTAGGAAVEGRIVLIAPGIIQASIATAIMFLRPLLRYMNGYKPEPGLACLKKSVSESYQFPEKEYGLVKIRFLLEGKDGVRIVEHSPRNMIKNVMESVGLFIAPPEKQGLARGEKITVYMLGGKAQLRPCGLEWWQTSPS